MTSERWRRHPLLSTRSPQGVLDYEIAQEQAAALGRLGRALERALAVLSEYERAHAGDARDMSFAKGTPARARLVNAASHALWCFIVQRESCGLGDARSIMRAYRVPAEVQNRVGALDSNPAQRLPRR